MLTLKQAALRLGLSRHWLRHLCQAGLIEAEQIEHRWFIPESAVQARLERALAWPNLAQAAALLGCSREYVRQLAVAGQFPGARKPAGRNGRWQIPQAVLLRWMERRVPRPQTKKERS